MSTTSEAAVPAAILERFVWTKAEEWRPCGKGWVHARADVHGESYVGRDAVIAPGAAVGRGVWIGDRSTIGPRCTIGAGAVIEADVTVLSGARLHDSNYIRRGVTIGENATLGADCWVGREARIGRGVAIGPRARLLDDVVARSNPIYLIGSREPVYAAGPHHIGIGCTVLRPDQWEAQYRVIAAWEGYSLAEVEEYERHARYVAAWLDAHGAAAFGSPGESP